MLARTKRKKVNIAKVKSTSVTFTIAKKEILEIIKTPIYLFNTMFTGVFVIIIFVIGFLNAAKEDMGANGGVLSLISKLHEKIYPFISKEFLLTIVIVFLVGFALALISGISNDPSATSISREGKKHKTSKIASDKFKRPNKGTHRCINTSKNYFTDSDFYSSYDCTRKIFLSDDFGVIGIRARLIFHFKLGSLL